MEGSRPRGLGTTAAPSLDQVSGPTVPESPDGAVASLRPLTLQLAESSNSALTPVTPGPSPPSSGSAPAEMVGTIVLASILSKTDPMLSAPPDSRSAAQQAFDAFLDEHRGPRPGDRPFAVRLERDDTPPPPIVTDE